MDYFFLHRKDRIVLTTIDVINEFGIQGVSTKEVAKRQGISEAAVFKHFPKKSDLMHAVFDFYSQYDNDLIVSSHMQENPLQAILFFVGRFAEYYENYPQITAITQSYEVLACDPDFAGRVKQLYFNRKKALCELVEKAQKAGFLSKEIGEEQLADVIWGYFHSVCLTWRFKNYSFSLKDHVADTLQILLNTFTTSRKRV